VGAPMAERGDVEGPQDRVDPPSVRACSPAYTSALADIDEEDGMGVKFLSEDWATAAQDAMNADPGFVGAIGGQTARLQQVVTGVPDGDVHYYVKLEDGKAEVAIGDVENPDATISQDYPTAKGISTGELSAVAAYMSGKLRVQGNLMKLMTMQGVLTQLPNALKDLDVDY
jgi:putative sterol carrier protein